MSESYCTTREAARLLGISHRTAQQWLERGYLNGWKTSGGHRRISLDSIEQMRMRHFREGVASPQQNQLKVLIIDDDPHLLKLYRAQMSRWPLNLAIHCASNGYEGLVMVGELAPSILICDLRLPGINGFQIVRSLSELDRLKAMTIVVVSGLAWEEIGAHGGLPPHVELMAKPINFARLQEIARGCHENAITCQPSKRVRQY